MLELLADPENPVFLDMLTRLVLSHNEVSRTPTEGSGAVSAGQGWTARIRLIPEPPQRARPDAMTVAGPGL